MGEMSRGGILRITAGRDTRDEDCCDGSMLGLHKSSYSGAL